MGQDVPQALQAAIEGYLGFFEMGSTLGSALFGATLFLLIRALGLVQDRDIARLIGLRLILLAGLCGLGLIVLGFLAHNVALSFFVELMQPTAFSGCEFPADRSPVSFFNQCHRLALRSLVWAASGIMALGIGAIGTWFILQSRSLPDAQDKIPR